MEYDEDLLISAFSKYDRIKNSFNTSSTIQVNNDEGSSIAKALETKMIKQYEETKASPKTANFLLFQRTLQKAHRESADIAINSRMELFKSFESKQIHNKEQNWSELCCDYINNRRKEDSNIIRIAEQSSNEENDIVLLQSQQQLNEATKRETISNKVKQKNFIRIYERLRQCYDEFIAQNKEITVLINHHVSNGEIKGLLNEGFKLSKTLVSNFSVLLSKVKKIQITENDIAEAEQYLQQVKTLRSILFACVNDYTTKKNMQKEVPVVPTKLNTGLDTIQNISKHNYEIYIQIMEFYKKYCHSFRDLETDNNSKDFRFQCKKSINIPVNAVSSLNSAHLKDKYIKLRNVLLNQTNIYKQTGNVQSLRYCVDLLAKKFVQQGDLMVAPNPESAFCYSRLILSLWVEFPDFGKVIQAIFYKQCPYLVPYYIPQMNDVSTKEYHIQLGYLYNSEGQVEPQDKFLKRMTGIMRLYFSLFIDKPGYNMKGQQTPLTMKDAWCWLSSILKLRPMCDITATILYIFFETVGCEMENSYGTVLKQLTRTILSQFIPRIKNVDAGGPISRLEILLHDYTKKGFAKPLGILPINF